MSNTRSATFISFSTHDDTATPRFQIGRKFPALRDSAQQILQKAFDKMVSNKEVEAGSTTAVIVGLSIEEYGSKKTNLYLTSTKDWLANSRLKTTEKKPEEPRTIFYNSANLGDSGKRLSQVIKTSFIFVPYIFLYKKRISGYQGWQKDIQIKRTATTRTLQRTFPVSYLSISWVSVQFFE